MRVLALIPLLLGLLAAPSWAADDIAGQWAGTWTKNGDALPVVVTFVKSDTIAVEWQHKEIRFDTYRGSFDSDALQVSAIPFAQVIFSAGRLHVELRGDETATMFDGTLSDGVLSGTFYEGSKPGTFRLTRVEAPKPPQPSRDVTFTNGKVTLSGTLVLPAGAGSHPAIVFLHGSGAEGRWANHWLAQKFAEAGVAALIYDKRGVGQSTGDWATSNFDDLAADAIAGIRYLQTQPDIDPKRIGLYGHSQGATIVPLVAERAPDVAFVIASAASGLKPIDLERFSVGNSMGISELAPAERTDADAFLEEVLEVAFDGKDRGALDAMVVRFKDRNWYFDLPGADSSYWAFSRAIADYRPLDHWRNVRAPALLVFGARDARVPAGQSADAIERALHAGGNRRVTAHTYPEANHNFVIVDPPPQPGTWPKREPDYARRLTDWVLSVTR